MSKPNKQTGAQREAKRLYKRFLDAFNKRIPLNVDPLRAVKDDLAKEAALICAKEILPTCIYAYLKKLYRDTQKEIKKL